MTRKKQYLLSAGKPAFIRINEEIRPFWENDSSTLSPERTDFLIKYTKLMG